VQQRPHPQLAAALIVISVVCLLAAALGEFFVTGHRPLGWATLALAVIFAMTGTRPMAARRLPPDVSAHHQRRCTRRSDLLGRLTGFARKP
jgi:hypothetical protein